MAHAARRAVCRFEAGASQTLRRKHRAWHIDPRAGRAGLLGRALQALGLRKLVDHTLQLRSDLKQAQAKRFAESIERGTLTLVRDALAFWGALYKPWGYESWWIIHYNSESSRLPLNRLLRLALPPDRFVNANGEPLARPAEPLRLQLQPPAEGGDDYELRLTDR